MHARKKYSNDEIIDRYFHEELQKEEQAQLFYKMNTDESLREAHADMQTYSAAAKSAAVHTERDIKSAVFAKIAESESSAEHKSGVFKKIYGAIGVACVFVLAVSAAFNIYLGQKTPSGPEPDAKPPIIAARPDTNAAPSTPDGDNVIEFEIEISRWLMPYVYPKEETKFETDTNGELISEDIKNFAQIHEHPKVHDSAEE